MQTPEQIKEQFPLKSFIIKVAENCKKYFTELSEEQINNYIHEQKGTIEQSYSEHVNNWTDENDFLKDASNVAYTIWMLW